MDENSNLQDQMARDAEREPGDAQKAWRLLAAEIDETGLPVWVKDYVKRSASVVADYDMSAGDQAQLAHMLGFYKEEKVQTRSTYDYDRILEWFIERMTEDVATGRKPNVSRTAREYADKVGTANDNPDSIRKAYEKARARLHAQMKQDIELQQLLAKRKK